MSYTGYEYWLNIIEAIEGFSSQKKQLDPKFFTYDGQDFTFAFERDLYFQILGNNFIKDVILSEASKTVFVPTQVQADVLSIAFPDKFFKLKKTTLFKEHVRKFFFSNLSLANLYLFCKARRHNFSVKHEPTTKSEIAFVTIHKKFVAYLSSIFEQIGDAAFIICGDENFSRDFCKDRNYKHVFHQKTVQFKSVPNFEAISLVIEYERAKKTLVDLNAKVVVLAEGNAPNDEIYNIASKTMGLKTICVQQGWSPVVHNGFRNMHYDFFLSWGRSFTDILSPFNPEQSFINVGSHVLKYHEQKNANLAISFFLQGKSVLISAQVYDEFLNFILWCAKSFPKENIIVREHPSTPVPQSIKNKLISMKNLKILNSDEYSLDEVLEQSKIAVSIYSTVLIEALAYGVVPFVCSFTSMKSYFPDLSQIGVEVSNINEAKRSMIDIVSKGQKFEKSSRFENFFYALGRDALENIVANVKN